MSLGDAICRHLQSQSLVFPIVFPGLSSLALSIVFVLVEYPGIVLDILARQAPKTLLHQLVGEHITMILCSSDNSSINIVNFKFTFK